MAEERPVYGSISKDNPHAGQMSNVSLSEVNATVSDAYGVLNDKMEVYNNANDALDQASQNYQDALSELSKYDGRIPDEVMADFKQAAEEKKAAEDAAEAAKKEAMEASEAVADAELQLEAKKAEREAERPNDMTYVVHTGQIYCKEYGLRSSYAGLTNSNGVYIWTLPQMTVEDKLPIENIINFGGCRSPENPSTIQAAREAADAARQQIEENKSWFEKKIIGGLKKTVTGQIISHFTSKKNGGDVDASLIAQCVGECEPIICSTRWSQGHEKVFINDSKALVRRCELICKYGGVIILETSGQPEA